MKLKCGAALRLLFVSEAAPVVFTSNKNLLVVVLIVQTTLAHLLSPGLMLLLLLLERGALFRGQKGEQFFVHLFHGRMKLLAERLHPLLCGGIESSLASLLVKLPQLVALCGGVSPVSFEDGAGLLLLRLCQIQFAQHAHQPAHALMAAPLSRLWRAVCWRLLLLSRRLLGQGARAEAECETEREAGSDQSIS